jgi:hypothetical protein
VERLRQLCERRARAYACAELRIATDGLSPEDVCTGLLEQLSSPRPRSISETG